jgi:hypothetical protein
MLKICVLLAFAFGRRGWGYKQVQNELSDKPLNPLYLEGIGYNE